MFANTRNDRQENDASWSTGRVTNHNAARFSDGSLATKDQDRYRKGAAQETRPSNLMRGAKLNPNKDRGADSNVVS
jgi:hypothetical protein